MKPFVADVHTHSLLSGHAFGTIRELAAEAAEAKDTKPQLSLISND